MELKPPGPIEAPPPERFLRGQKRSRPARRVGRLALRVAATFVVAASLVAAGTWAASKAGQSPELAVDRILVEGNERLSDGEILELLELSESANILMLDLEDVRAKLLRSAWVSDVEIERVLPATLELRIQEREPVAVAVLDEMYLLASDGTMLDQLSPRYDIDELVLVRGLRRASGLVPERAELAGRLAAALYTDAELGPLVSELDVNAGASSVLVRLRTPPVVMLVAAETMIARLNELVPLLEGIRGRYQELEVVDLRFNGRVYLRLYENTGRVERDMVNAAGLASGGASF